MTDKLSSLLDLASKDQKDVGKRRQREIERKADATRKQKEADDVAFKKIWGWKEEGAKSAKRVQHAFAGVKAILIPHKSKKLMILELEGKCQIVNAGISTSWMRVSGRLLDTIRPLRLLYKQKSRCIHRKHIVIRELYNLRRAQNTLSFCPDSDFPFEYPYSEDAVLKPMEESYSRRVPVGPSKIMLLRMLRSEVKQTRDLWQRSVDGINRCESMLVCTSIYHGRLAGCSKCGLIVIKGEMMVESVDRVTNTSIIVRRDFEMDILDRERIEYAEKYSMLYAQLKRVEEELRLKTVYDIQAWWATRIAIRKAKRGRLRMEDSLWYRRIRRLVKMKRTVDEFDPWTSTLEQLEIEFCDLLPELSEYRLYKSKKALALAIKFARIILDNAKTKHAAAVFKERHRERKRYERLASMEMQRQRELRVEQSLRHQMIEKTKNILARTWMCDRFECDKRIFLSEFRYNTHMKLHRMKDSKGMKSRDELYRLKMARRRKEDLFIERVNMLRCGMIGIRGDNGDGSRSPIKTIQLPAITRKYMTKLPLLSSSDQSIISRLECPDCVEGEKDASESMTVADLIDEFELSCLQYSPPESDDCSEELFADRFDCLILKTNHLKSHEHIGLTCADCTYSKEVEGEIQNVSTLDKHNVAVEDSSASGMDLRGLHSVPYAQRRQIMAEHSIFSTCDNSSNADQNQSLNGKLKAKSLTPSWLSVPQLTTLSESVQSNMKMYFEVVSKVESVDISSPKFILDKHVIRIGTLGSCDFSLRCNDSGGDIRTIRRISRIHCLIYVPLVLQQYRHCENISGTVVPQNGMQLNIAAETSSASNIEIQEGSKDEVVTHKHATIVDNHSAWGTYVVSVNGVHKVPTTIQRALPLVPGDLVCIGVVRNGPQTMSPIDANKALVVFRVRIG